MSVLRRLYRGETTANFIGRRWWGFGLSILLGGALMGLVFLSSGTGHDERSRDATEKKRD